MEQGCINLHVFARRYDEANSVAEREIAAPRKSTGVRNDVNNDLGEWKVLRNKKLNVFARRHNEANSATEREIAAPRKISDLRPGTEDSGVRNDIPIAFIVNWFKVNSWRTFHKSASAKSE
jgi:hypothetical protein